MYVYEWMLFVFCVIINDCQNEIEKCEFEWKKNWRKKKAKKQIKRCSNDVMSDRGWVFYIFIIEICNKAHTKTEKKKKE